MPSSQAPSEQVYVLKITHKHGTDVIVCRTEEEAQTALFEYVSEWWGNEMGGKRMPADHKKAISLYFDKTDYEYWEIAPTYVRP
jgi:hypothetical protein